MSVIELKVVLSSENGLQNGTINNNKINYEDCMNIVNKLKFNNDSDLFVLKRDEDLKAIIDNNTLVAITLLIAQSNLKEK